MDTGARRTHREQAKHRGLCREVDAVLADGDLHAIPYHAWYGHVNPYFVGVVGPRIVAYHSYMITPILNSLNRLCSELLGLWRHSSKGRVVVPGSRWLLLWPLPITGVDRILQHREINQAGAGVKCAAVATASANDEPPRRGSSRSEELTHAHSWSCRHHTEGRKKSCPR